MSTIHPDTNISRLHLRVASVDDSIQFYQIALGMQVLNREGDTARLGAGKNDFLILTQDPNAAPRNPRLPGLYHFAVLVPSRLELARVLKNLSDTQTPMGGFADHLVSEAIYLTDPDDNGIEIYRDRPRDEWRLDGDGRLLMTTDPLDLRGLIGELERQPNGWKGMHPNTRLGHIHLQVDAIASAERFYVDVLGFDLVTRYGPSASFVSAGGYHHHIGMNTWQSRGAPPPPPNMLGLRTYTIHLPNAAELGRVAERIREAGIAADEIEEGILVHDPAQNGIVLST